MAKINRKQDLLARLAQVNKLGLPYEVELGNNLVSNDSHQRRTQVVQILRDGYAEVKVDPKVDGTKKYGWADITLPFVDFWDQTNGLSGGGKVFQFPLKHTKALGINKVNRREIREEKDGDEFYCSIGSTPIELHAIYDPRADTTHYFLMKKG